MHEYDLSAVFIPFETAQKHFNVRKSASAIEINISNPDDSNAFTSDLKNYLYDFEQQITVNDWKEANSSFINAIKVERNVMFIILSFNYYRGWV